MYDYFDILGRMVEFIEEFEKDILGEYFDDEKSDKAGNEYFCFTPRYCQHWQPIKDIISVCDFFGIERLEHMKKNLLMHIDFLCHYETASQKVYFKRHINFIKNCFRRVMSEVKNRLSLLEPEEYIRLNEALNCYIQECNYSTVAMSVSAVESRLFSLLMKKDPNLKLEKLTLGQLIREYLDNKEKYGNIVPEKHEDLLQLFNTYRVLSIHPKREKIPRPVVTAIINMTLAFLFDEELRLNEKTNLKS